MTADNKATSDGSPAELNDAFEGRIVDIFVWLLTDHLIDDKSVN